MYFLKIKNYCAEIFYLFQSFMLVFDVSIIKLRGLNRFKVGKATERKELLTLLGALKPSEFNGHLIRVGSKGDGGYLMPHDCFNANACFSPGVDLKADFELEFASAGIPCFMADFSVEAPPIKHPLFNFKKKFIGVPVNQNFIRLDDWVDSCFTNAKELVLQMDIEGHEFDAINQIDAAFLKKFQILSIEFHSMDHLIDNKIFKTISSALNKLLKGHFVAHIHANNNTRSFSAYKCAVPRVFEVTFLSRSFYKQGQKYTKLPHKLDAKSIKENSDIDINKMWP